MTPMQSLRSFTLLTRCVLVWFVVALGVAVASPLVKPQDLLLVCSASGAMKVLVQIDDGSVSEVVDNTVHCPLCATAGAPPPPPRVSVAPFQPLSFALLGIPSAHIAARTAAPLPARGPPNA